MARSVRVGAFIQFFALSSLSIFICLSARGEDTDKTGLTLDEARARYEEKIQATRDDVLERIEKEIVRHRAKPNPEEKEIDDLKNAKSAFNNAGRWPSFKSIKDCQTNARIARNDLEKALERARKDYLRAARDDAAKAVKAECEQFLKESDIVPWGDNLVTGPEGEQRTIGPAHQTFEVGDLASRNHRLEIVVQRLEGNGPLTIAIPVPGKKRLEIKTIPGSDPELRVLLSVRDSLISADLGIPRPVPTNFSVDDSPGKLVLFADQGKFEVKSIRIKPILAEAAVEVAQKQQHSPKYNRPEGPGNVAPETSNVDPASELTKKSNWRGGRWHGQNPVALEGPQPSNATVTRRDANEVELTTERWGGGTGSVHWVFTINRGQLTLMNIFVRGGNAAIFTDVLGDGTVNGGSLQFTWSARVIANGANKIFRGEFQLKRDP
jgi:hypothetical protein